MSDWASGLSLGAWRRSRASISSIEGPAASTGARAGAAARQRYHRLIGFRRAGPLGLGSGVGIVRRPLIARAPPQHIAQPNKDHDREYQKQQRINIESFTDDLPTARITCQGRILCARARRRNPQDRILGRAFKICQRELRSSEEKPALARISKLTAFGGAKPTQNPFALNRFAITTNEASSVFVAAPWNCGRFNPMLARTGRTGTDGERQGAGDQPKKTNGDGPSPGSAQAAPAAGEGGQAKPSPQLKMLALYVKDLSFESPGAPKSLQGPGENPQLRVNVNVNAGPRGRTPTRSAPARGPRQQRPRRHRQCRARVWGPVPAARLAGESVAPGLVCRLPDDPVSVRPPRSLRRRPRRGLPPAVARPDLFRQALRPEIHAGGRESSGSAKN